jgi:hypothetical protein
VYATWALFNNNAIQLYIATITDYDRILLIFSETVIRVGVGDVALV